MIMPLLWFPILIWLGLNDSYILALLWSIICAITQGILHKFDRTLSNTDVIEFWNVHVNIPFDAYIYYKMINKDKK